MCHGLPPLWIHRQAELNAERMEEDPCDDNQVAMAKETSPTAQHRCRHMQAFVCMRMCPYMCAGAVDAMM